MRFKFDSEAVGFSMNNAELLARVSGIVYNMKSTTSYNKLNDLGFRSTKYFDCHDTQAIITMDDKNMILAFRGTDNLADVMTDLDIDLVAGAGGRVHEGFSLALGYVWRDILKYIIEHRGKRFLWVTGHSLGAALATLAVAKLRLEKDEPVNGLYTFGQPRTGDREFAKNFNLEFGDKTFRFVNNNDVVTRVPFRVMGYSHVGTFKYFDEYGNFHNRMVWWKKLLDRINGRIRDILEKGTDGIKDHAIEEYVKNFNQYFIK